MKIGWKNSLGFDLPVLLYLDLLLNDLVNGCQIVEEYLIDVLFRGI